MPAKGNRLAGVLPGPTTLTRLLGNTARARMFVDGYVLGDMGTGDFTLSLDQDILDIMYGDSPQGTKPSARVITGTSLTLTASVSGNALTMQVLDKLSNVIQDNHSEDKDNALLRSGTFIETPRYAIKIVAIDGEGNLSYDPSDCLNLYDVDFTIENLFSFNSSDQLSINITGMAYARLFSEAERAPFGDDAPSSAIGYLGDNEANKVPVLNWPDRTAAYATGGEIAAGTDVIAVTFNKGVSLDSSVTPPATFTINGNPGTVQSSTLTSPTLFSITTAADEVSAGDVVIVTLAKGAFVAVNNNVPSDEQVFTAVNNKS